MLLRFCLFFLATFLSISCQENVKDSEKSTKSEFQWKYGTLNDEMDGGKTYYASIKSKNKAEFDFPYEGGSYLFFKYSKEKENESVFLRITKGQFSIGLGDLNHVRIRFDDEEPMNFKYFDSDKLEFILLKDFKPISGKLKTAKKMKIEASFYGAIKIFDFDIEGFSEEEMKKAK
jgi:hypothetical protein